MTTDIANLQRALALADDEMQRLRVELATVRANLDQVKASRDAERAARRAVVEAARAYLDCFCSHGVHWVDVEGEAEAEGCDLRIELDDLLRALEASQQ